MNLTTNNKFENMFHSVKGISTRITKTRNIRYSLLIKAELKNKNTHYIEAVLF